MSPEFLREIIENLEHEKKETELKRELMGKAIDIVTEYGRPATIPLSEKIMTLISFNSVYPMHKRSEFINVREIGGLIQDEKGSSSIGIAVASHGKKEPSKADLISVAVSHVTENGMDTLLLRKYGEKIGARMWNGRYNIMWAETESASTGNLKTISDTLTLFQTSLRQKITPAAGR